jgi:hypothetical protein
MSRIRPRLSGAGFERTWSRDGRRVLTFGSSLTVHSSEKADPIFILDTDAFEAPAGRLTRMKLAAVALHEHALQAPVHIVIDLPKLVGGITGAKVRPPPAQHRIQLRDGVAQVPMTRGAGCERLHTLSNPLHRPPRRPSLEVVHPLVSALPDGSAHALAQVTAERIESRRPSREVDASRLLRVELQTQPREHLAYASQMSTLGRSLRSWTRRLCRIP